MDGNAVPVSETSPVMGAVDAFDAVVRESVGALDRMNAVATALSSAVQRGHRHTVVDGRVVGGGVEVLCRCREWMPAAGHNQHYLERVQQAIVLSRDTPSPLA